MVLEVFQMYVLEPIVVTSALYATSVKKDNKNPFIV